MLPPHMDLWQMQNRKRQISCLDKQEQERKERAKSGGRKGENSGGSRLGEKKD